MPPTPRRVQLALLEPDRVETAESLLISTDCAVAGAEDLQAQHTSAPVGSDLLPGICCFPEDVVLPR